MMAEQRKLTGQQDNKNEKREKLKAEIEGRENPKTREIATCENLIAYCNKLKVQ
jgi:hypothetical protein